MGVPENTLIPNISHTEYCDFLGFLNIISYYYAGKYFAMCRFYCNAVSWEKIKFCGRACQRSAVMVIEKFCHVIIKIQNRYRNGKIIGRQKDSSSKKIVIKIFIKYLNCAIKNILLMIEKIFHRLQNNICNQRKFVIRKFAIEIGSSPEKIIIDNQKWPPKRIKDSSSKNCYRIKIVITAARCSN
jgi:hypothetical protein